MKNKIFSILFALVLVLSFSLVTAVPALAATAPDLGTAKSFAVLGGPAVTLTNSTVTGDVGSGFPFPGSAVTLTGSTITGGTVHEGDAIAVAAYADFLSAYNALADVPYGETLTGTLAGMTLLPGVYSFDAAVTETGGTLTLEGSSTDTWIFKIGTLGTGALTGTSFSVVMAGGGQASNVYWWVADAATLTDSNFQGTILAGAAITVNGGTFSGNSLAKAAVTLTGATITVPGGGGTPADTTPPTVSSTIPANAATGVAINSAVTATFSEALDPLTVTTTFTLEQGLTPVSGTVTYADVTATFTPASNLAPSTVYTATITTGAKDLAGNALASNYVWSFTTATPTAQAPVDLGAAANYAVLASSTVTNTGPTVVGGDLGLSPGVAVTGFAISSNTVVQGITSTGLTDGPGIVKGTIHIADTAIDPVESTTSAAQAQLDLTTAYNDAAGRTVEPVDVAGNLGGQTLYPGLYKSTSSLEISSGDLTLDAQGDADAVFIFQMGSTLTTTTGREVILTNGAKASNIFWQVGSSATLGTYSVFKGNILAYTSITIATGATLNGRALASNGAVTLDTNIIAIAVPSGASAPPVPAVIDINPNTLNLKSQSDKNAITVYIELPLGFDPGQISVATVELNVFGTTIPALSLTSRVLKFDRSAVIAALGETTGDINVTVTGELNNGRTFVGSDTIKVVNPGK